MSRVRVSVRPSNLYTRKTSKLSGNSGGLRVLFNEWGAPSGAGGHGWAPMNSDSMCGGR